MAEAKVPLQLRAEIFCGANIATREGAPVTEAEFARFLSHHVSGFPGYTVFSAEGHWSGEGRWQGKEQTRVIVLYGPNSPTFKDEIKRLARNYAVMFDQDSVAVGLTLSAFGFVKQTEDANVE